MKNILPIFAFIISPTVLADNNQCENNFTEEGGFFSGKTFKTSAEFSGVKKDKAYKNVYLYTVKNGYKIIESDKEMGIISASQNVSYGKGKTAPLNIIVEELGKSDSKVSITYAVSGGVTSPSNAVKEYFCNTLAQVKN